MIEIKLNGEYIKLDQLLKVSNLVSSGGEAKVLIKQELVRLNGKIEIQRGKKIKCGDVVELNGKKVKVV